MHDPKSAEAEADARQLHRLLFFSDAVFAIVLTLLVLELRPPHGETDAELQQGLAAMSLHFLAFAISFALGSAFWLAHMRTMRGMQKFDWPTTAANLLHLSAVALTPFASAFLGEHVASIVAFEVYAGLVVFVSFTSCLLWLVASREGGRLMGGLTIRNRIAVAIRTSGIGWCFLIGIGLIQIGEVGIARFCWILMAPLMAIAAIVAGRPKKRVKKTAPAAAA